MRVLGLVLLCLLGTVRGAAAQSHPCDTPGPATQTVAADLPHRLQWCSPAADALEALIAIIDGTPIDLLPVTAKTAPSAVGKVLYESPLFLQVPPGQHVLTAAVYNRDALTGQLQVGLPSAPFSFAAVRNTPKPEPPAILGVAR